MSNSTQPGDPSASGPTPDPVAITALVVSLVALLTTLAQLLQQYFATADGYRRCQRSVMGDWAKFTRLRWRWREFRFETMYTVPEIVFLIGSDANAKPGLMISNGDLDISDAMTLKSRRQTPSPTVHTDEMAGWVRLLPELQDMTLKMEKWTDRSSVPFGQVLLKPAVECRELSWDFQLPDVSRPLAKTTLSVIAVLARRMGMRWKDFRPEDGIMRAEGHNHVITATIVRSLGLVLQYNNTGGRSVVRKNGFLQWKSLYFGFAKKEQEEVYIPDHVADFLGAGFVLTDLAFPSFAVGTAEDIISAMDVLDSTGFCAQSLRFGLRENPDIKFPVADLVALTSKMICFRGCSLVQVPAPSKNVDGITTDPLGRVIFQVTLEKYEREHGIGDKTAWVLQQMREMANSSQYPEWTKTQSGDPTRTAEDWVVRRDMPYLEKLISLHAETTELLIELLNAMHLPILGLLQAHIAVAIFGIQDIQTESEQDIGKSLASRVNGNLGTQISSYFETLPRLVEWWGNDKFGQEAIIDAWMLMMFRGFCWGAAHFFVPGETVPIAYYDSQLPVYLS